MAIRLEKAGWSSADFWLRRQTSYDLAQARKGEDKIQVEGLPAAAYGVGNMRHGKRVEPYLTPISLSRSWPSLLRFWWCSGRPPLWSLPLAPVDR